MKTFEVNFDGIPGPTHNYGGLSYGNIASTENMYKISNPREAARQGLLKIKTLHDLGIVQGVIPPQLRPDLEFLKKIGFSGGYEKIISEALRESPELIASAFSSSSMWTANAATVTPSCDSVDSRVHITPANLTSKLHRSVEAPFTAKILRKIFDSKSIFCHHDMLPLHSSFADEGAANHIRLSEKHGNPGVNLFVYGRRWFGESENMPSRFPARQTLEASMAVARKHLLNLDRVVFARQNPEVIDQGVFHNDVISMGNENIFIYHEDSFENSENVIREIKEKFEGKLKLIKVKQSEISVKEAVSSYFFNSQLVTKEDGNMVLIVPSECNENDRVSNYLKYLLYSVDEITEIIPLDLRQSMKNGGGPACLRLRVVLNEKELSSVKQKVLLSDDLFELLNTWIGKYYRDRISIKDLLDISVYRESMEALEELTKILDLGSIYTFQH